MILADNETGVDLLNNEAIAVTIIRMLTDRPERPITIGVHGDWGAGKSSILEMIDAGLAGNEDVLCLKFNGWRFQGFEDAKIALIEGIVTGLIEKRPALSKAASTVKEIFSRIDWLKVAKKAGSLALTAYTGIPSPEIVGSILATLEGALSDPVKLATKENFATAIEGAKSLLKPAQTKSVPKEVEEFRKAFDTLLKEAGVKQLVVLIDDLDRCLPDTAIETLEAIRLFVFTAHTAFIVAADEAMIEYAVRKHFPELPDTTGPRDYARNYLEKLIQVPFRIPALGDTETRIYVTLLLAGAEVGESTAGFSRLIDAARQKLKRPWETGPLDAATIRQALGAEADKVNNALMLSDQIGPILGNGTKGNPRQIKRFLNTLLLRQRTADARGFGDEILLPVLAKLMLAERFLPALFDQIATAAVSNPQGICMDLAVLEKTSRGDTPTGEAGKQTGEGDKEAKTGDVPAAVVESAVLSEWKASPAIAAWAQVQPALGATDFRPYLFVTKDKKDYFGPASVLGHLATVAEKLFGPKIAVQSLEGELKQLAPPEAEKLFEAVRTRIMGGDAFTTQPLGIDGIIVLVKAQPSLQGRLLDFIQALPVQRCGPWVVGGWRGAIIDQENKKRLDAVIEGWARVSGNDALRIAAEGVAKTPKGGR